MKPARRRGRSSARALRSSSRSSRRTSSTSRTVGGVRLDLASEDAVREAARRHSRPRTRGETRCAHRRRDRPADDRASQGARTDRRHCRRSDVRPGHRLRAGRHRGRSDRRQGAGAAAARSQDGQRPDRAHAGVAHPQGLSQRARRQRNATSSFCWSSLRNWWPTFPKFANSIINPLLADETGVIAVDVRISRRAARSRRRTSRRLRQPAFRDASVSERMGAAHAIARRQGNSCSSGAARGRAALRAILRRHDAGRFAASLLRAGEAFQSPLCRPPDSDRLRAGHGVRCHRRDQRSAVGRRAAARGCQLRERRICHPHSLRPQGSRASAGC